MSKNKLNEEVENLYDDFGICEGEDCPKCRDIKEGIQKIIKQAEIRVAEHIEKEMAGKVGYQDHHEYLDYLAEILDDIINKTKESDAT